jgi:hypothetical protein
MIYVIGLAVSAAAIHGNVMLLITLSGKSAHKDISMRNTPSKSTN